MSRGSMPCTLRSFFLWRRDRDDDPHQEIRIAYGSFQFKGIEEDEEVHGIFPGCLRSYAAACAPPIRKPTCNSEPLGSLTLSPEPSHASAAASQT
jgi:hypothetical protein